MSSDDSDNSKSQGYKTEKDCLIQLGNWMNSRENKSLH